MPDSMDKLMTKILIEPHELHDLIQEKDVVIIDTRSPEEYAQYHVQSAVNIHEIFTYLASSTPQGMQDMREHFAKKFGEAGVDKDQLVIFYEQGMETGFGQSCRGHFMLSYLGNSTSYVLHGGLMAWINAGYQITDHVSRTATKTFELTDDGIDMIVGKDDVLAQLSKSEVTLLDVRDVDEWTGESSSPYGKDFSPRRGRIPGAKWLEWYRMMKPNGRVKSPSEIRAECLNIGMDFSKPVWLYCFKGSRTSNTYVALKQAGFENVATYFGSWNEWSQDESLPIEEGLPIR
jgi:thiosulfate/3-mercaptopyruvate sulfurtransferase